MSEKFLEQALEKSDGELFKELFRTYPLAEVEDYFKAGSWQNALMQTDLQLFLAQREESGALPLPALEELTLPKLPEAAKVIEGKPAEAVKAERVIVTKALPQAETLQILVFVNKHGLDLTKTKALLAPLELSIREPLMADFSPGPDGRVLTQLQDFMEKSGISFERIEEVATPMASDAGTKVSDASPLASPASKAPAVPAAASAPRPAGPVAAGPLKPGLVVPKVIPAKAPVKTPPVKTPPVRPPISPKPPSTVPPKHLLVARGPPSKLPGPAVSKPMPPMLAAKLPMKRPMETPTFPLQKRPHLVAPERPKVVPERPKVVPERPKGPHVIRPKVAPYPAGFPVPKLPLRPRWP